MKYVVAGAIALPLPLVVGMMWSVPSLALLTFAVTATCALLYLRSRRTPAV